MVENTVRVVVDEALSRFVKQSYLVAELVVDGKILGRVTFRREASPEQISEVFNETGCLIKYDEETGLPEEENIGDLFIEASYVVPGLGKE